MNSILNLLYLLLLGYVANVIRAQSAPYNGRSFYSSVVTPNSQYYHHSGGFVPLSYKSDLIPEESKHRSAPKYSKQTSYRGYGSDEDVSSERFSSDEFSNEARHQQHPYSSKEHDSQEYTIGTHIRVQHPITAPKKSTKHSTPSSKYSTLPSSYTLGEESHEERGGSDYLPPLTKKQKYLKHFDADPFHVISPPKSTAATHIHHPSIASSQSFNVYDTIDPAESYESSDVPLKKSKSHARDRFKGVASKKQIEQYLEDQEKLLDEALKLQLLSSPKFQKLLKATEKEPEFEEGEYLSNVPPPFRDNFHKGRPGSRRPRRRPNNGDFKRSPGKSKSIIMSKPNRQYRQAVVIEV